MKGSSSPTPSTCQRGQKKRSKSIDRDRCKDRDLGHNCCVTCPELNREHHLRKMNRNKEYRSRRKDSYNDQRNKTKSKKSKYTKKNRYHNRNRSCSMSSSSSSSSSRCSHTSRNSKYSNTTMNKIKTENSESNAHCSTFTTPTTTSRTNQIDLLDVKIQKALEDIEQDAFVSKVFYSTRDREAPASLPAKDKVIIDLNTETVTFSKPVEMPISDTFDIVVYHPNFLGNAEKKQDRWLRKLFIYRQKCMNE